MKISTITQIFLNVPLCRIFDESVVKNYCNVLNDIKKTKYLYLKEIKLKSLIFNSKQLNQYVLIIKVKIIEKRDSIYRSERFLLLTSKVNFFLNLCLMNYIIHLL